MRYKTKNIIISKIESIDSFFVINILINKSRKKRRTFNYENKNREPITDSVLKISKKRRFNFAFFRIKHFERRNNEYLFIILFNFNTKKRNNFSNNIRFILISFINLFEKTVSTKKKIFYNKYKNILKRNKRELYFCIKIYINTTIY